MSDAATLTRFSFPILKWEKTPDGDIVVEGCATDGTLDADHQIVDTDWSGKALDTWLKTGGNVRVQHSPFLYPAGRGLALDLDQDSKGAHWLKALVVEDTAKKLVEKGVLRDFSIGILDPRVVRDHLAPGGRIVDGRIGEVSLVDRGSNKNSSFTIAKAAPDGPAELICKMTGAVPSDHPQQMAVAIYKRKFSAERRRQLAARNHALPDGSYPIDGPEDLGPAANLQRSGHGNTAAAGRLIARRAKDLGVANPLDKADPTDDEHETGSKACLGCRTKNPADAKSCTECGRKLGMSLKGDGAQDHPAGPDDDEEDEPADETDAGDEVDDGEDGPGEANKGDLPPFLRGKKPKKNKVPSQFKGGRTPAKAGRVKKPMSPVPEHREPDGAVIEPAERDAGLPVGHEEGDGFGVPGSKWTAEKSAGGVPLAWQVLHDATCPGLRWSEVRKHYGLESVADAIPLEDLQAVAADAIVKGVTDAADDLLGLVKCADFLVELENRDLREIRKAYPDLIPSVHPAQHTDMTPSQFRRGYLGAGHPNLSAMPHSGSRPAAVHHHVSAAEFTRGYLTGGRPPEDSAGRNATSSTALVGQAVTSMQRLHQHAKLAYPDLCHLDVTHRDYTRGDGETGFGAPSFPGRMPTSPGEAGNSPTNYAKGNGGRPRSITKMRKKMKRLERENAELGAQPDPDQAPFRGIPTFGGPVERASYIDKAMASAGSAGDAVDEEYVSFLRFHANSGDPAARGNARSVLKGMGISAETEEDEE